MIHTCMTATVSLFPKSKVGNTKAKQNRKRADKTSANKYGPSLLNNLNRRAFSVAGPTVWNSLPRELRDPACGFDSFKQFLKTILFSLY